MTFCTEGKAHIFHHELPFNNFASPKNDSNLAHGKKSLASVELDFSDHDPTNFYLAAQSEPANRVNNVFYKRKDRIFKILLARYGGNTLSRLNGLGC
jgi:hypothetical protein